ncbi:MAG TPA: trypsin-like peptidase domain-containing protein [Acetobacteraceae bacterium]|nr:trypsin-like peptidase domain-containing protein [Acetobacteraceae bacterium]
MLAAANATSATDMIASVLPTVVSIAITKQSSVSGGSNIAAQTAVTEDKGVSSGFFINPNGTILTNRHVIADATEIIVTLHDRTRLRATVLATADHSDLALLQVHAGKPVPAAQLGNSDDLRQGDPVFAVGNPLGLGNTVTAGIVSALDRVRQESAFGTFFQIDAALNKGNSGGPVFDQTGQAVGISTAFLTGGNETGSVGLGLVIPSDDARLIVERLNAGGHDTLGWIGVHVQSVTPDIASAARLPSPAASIVARVDPDSPAMSAALGPGDIILAVDGENGMQPQRLNRVLAAASVGSVAQVTVWRDGQSQDVPVTIGEFPTAGKTAITAVPHEAESGRGQLGLVLAPLTNDARARLGMTPQAPGAFVDGVAPDSAAWERGITAGSAIVNIDRQPVASPADARRHMQEAIDGGRPYLLVQVHDTQGLHWLVLPTAREGAN